jgi:hypothetical protein
VRRAKYVFLAVVAIALVVVTFQAYSIKSSMKASLTSSFAPASSGINYPNPISPNITVTGVMTAVVISPACSLSTPPCAVVNTPLYYVNVNGWNYRLVFPQSMKAPMNRARILVTGVFVTPSDYVENQWTPQISFRGDIYVVSYSYVSPYY